MSASASHTRVLGRAVEPWRSRWSAHELGRGGALVEAARAGAVLGARPGSGTSPLGGERILARARPSPS